MRSIGELKLTESEIIDLKKQLELYEAGIQIEIFFKAKNKEEATVYEGEIKKFIGISGGFYSFDIGQINDDFAHKICTGRIIAVRASYKSSMWISIKDFLYKN